MSRPLWRRSCGEFITPNQTKLLSEFRQYVTIAVSCRIRHVSSTVFEKIFVDARNLNNDSGLRANIEFYH